MWGCGLLLCNIKIYNQSKKQTNIFKMNLIYEVATYKNRPQELFSPYTLKQVELLDCSTYLLKHRGFGVRPAWFRVGSEASAWHTVDSINMYLKK